MLGMFGEADHIISLDKVRRFRNALERKICCQNSHNLSGRSIIYTTCFKNWELARREPTPAKTNFSITSGMKQRVL